jgi:hypothetical protein
MADCEKVDHHLRTGSNKHIFSGVGGTGAMFVGAQKKTPQKGKREEGKKERII